MKKIKMEDIKNVLKKAREEEKDFSEPNVVLNKGLYEYILNRLNELAKIETKIEDGTLIELPCKVGDKAYLVHNETQRYPFEFVVEDVRYMKGSWFVDSSTYGGKVGKYVFFTKAEAEAKLRELQGDK